MNIPVSLADCEVPWRFHGSQRLDAWISRASWLETGDVAVVRVPSAETAEFLDPYIRGFIRSVDGGRSHQLQFISISGENLNGSICSAFCEALGQLTTGSIFDQLDRIAIACCNVPTIVFLGPRPMDQPQFVEDTRLLVDRVSKLSRPVAITVVVFVDRDCPIQNDEADFTVGEPYECVLSQLDAVPAVLWSAYVHTRVSWECGGDVALSVRLSREILPHLKVEDDDGLEHIFNDTASKLFTALPATPQKRLRESTSLWNSLDWLGDRSIIPAVWAPLGSMELRPTAWCARALLQLSTTRHEWKSFLRHCLVCRPLAREMAVRCFEIESRERTRLHRRYGETEPTPEIDKRFQAFSDGRNGSARLFYPAGHPSIPDTAMSIATLGELVHAVQEINGKIPSYLHDLKHLRNAIAHGHYASWAMLRSLKDIQDDAS